MDSFVFSACVDRSMYARNYDAFMSVFIYDSMHACCVYLIMYAGSIARLFRTLSRFSAL